MGERIIQTGDVEICAEAFGNPTDPAILLIMGAGASMLRWDDEFVERLVAGGRYCIRYDNRDTGRSTTYPPGEPPYTLHDMRNDAIAVLDAYGIDKAHVAGRSMGGMITQHVVLDHPNRVLTATLIYSSPSPGVARGENTTELPGTTDELRAATADAPPADASEDEKMAHRMSTQRILNGSRYPFDQQRAEALIAREMARARDFEASGNHGVAIGNTPEWRDRLGEISTPTLVIHGTEDPILPFPHGQVLAAEIQGAELMVLEGVGHALPAPVWSDVIAAMLRHAS